MPMVSTCAPTSRTDMLDLKLKQFNQPLIIMLLFFAAHNHVIACREKLQRLAVEKASLDLLRRQVGECLYTIQSFYSNTNWVEMYGGTPYLDFGELVFRHWLRKYS